MNRNEKNRSYRAKAQTTPAFKNSRSRTMSRDKSPATTYVTRMLSTTTRTQLQEILEEAPLSTEEKNFILDIHGHSSLKDLATKYGYTISGIAKKKQKVYTRLHRFDISRLTR